LRIAEIGAENRSIPGRRLSSAIVGLGPFRGIFFTSLPIGRRRHLGPVRVALPEGLLLLLGVERPGRAVRLEVAEPRLVEEVVGRVHVDDVPARGRARGDDLRYAANQVGHKDVRFLLNVYARATTPPARMAKPQREAYERALSWFEEAPVVAQSGTNELAATLAASAPAGRGH